MMGDERGKPRVMSCAARNVVAYPPTAIPKLIAAKKEQQDSPAIPLFTTTLSRNLFLRSKKKFVNTIK